MKNAKEEIITKRKANCRQRNLFDMSTTNCLLQDLIRSPFLFAAYCTYSNIHTAMNTNIRNSEYCLLLTYQRC